MRDNIIISTTNIPAALAMLDNSEREANKQLHLGITKKRAKKILSAIGDNIYGLANIENAYTKRICLEILANDSL